MTERAVVVGGGLAGIAAAADLALAGRDVVLLESRPRLGGATYSFARGDLTVDTGQHVMLRCYRNYYALLGRLGVAQRMHIQERLDIPVLLESNPGTRLRRGRFGPAPLHLLPALTRYRALSPGERVRAARAAAALRHVDPDDPSTDLSTFGSWLDRHGQRGRPTRRLWEMLCVAALNIEARQASLALMARVVRTGLLDDVRAGDVGISTVALSALHDQPAREYLERLGVRVHCRTRVTALDPTPDGVVVRTGTGEIDAGHVVVAVPHRQAASLVPALAVPDRDAWSGLGSSPIVNVHLHFDRPVTEFAFSAAPESDVQWIFDRTTAADAGRGQYLVLSVSGADAQIDRPTRELVDAQLRELGRLLPRTRTATVLDAFVTREPHATFRQRAGTAALRPAATTALPQVVLAGAWTSTGWPDTMEGAVRSGIRAAEAVIGAVDRPRSVVATDG